MATQFMMNVASNCLNHHFNACATYNNAINFFTVEYFFIHRYILIKDQEINNRESWIR